MTDILSSHDRSRRMAGVRQSSTTPELALRSALHGRGFRFRVNARELPGSPDILLPKYRTALFVHGCFWHGHSCRAGRAPTTNQDYWLPKLDANRSRDRRKARLLRALGWRVLTVWECQLKGPGKLEATADRVAKTIVDGSSRRPTERRLTRPPPPSASAP